MRQDGRGERTTLITPTHSAAHPGLSVAIDGGNSKTEVVVLGAGPDGLQERTRAIGPGSGTGPNAVAAAVSDLLIEGGVDVAAVRRVSAAVAGLDFPGDEVGHSAVLSRLFPNAEVDVVGDAVAVLDAGAGLGDALAIVCGAGLNAIARGPYGLTTVPALGWPSGDGAAGGGDQLGREAVRAAARAEDGRGPATTLLPLVLAATGTADTIALARAIRDGAVTMRDVGALAATVTRAAAEGDAVATALRDDAAREAVLLASVVAGRAWGGAVSPGTAATPATPPAAATIPPGTPAVLAGGVFSDPGFRDLVADGLRDLGFDPRPLEFRPVDGLVRAITKRAEPTERTERKDPR
ncbi:hypothetical protein [Leifsonia sp. fls2-241-R2A-40a]|uniref:hypothetical protein n=1 Tax=Leifsonia sp. fls2-241-R2A-40a TaxID=3040290 RepID=UPI0025500110|nr:hypothetical protein [Leifsonia sp. fls2-241-R2A-40a]